MLGADAPAMSMLARRTPPKIVPCGLVMLGSSRFEWRIRLGHVLLRSGSDAAELRKDFAPDQRNRRMSFLLRTEMAVRDRSIPFYSWSTDREACCGWALGAWLLRSYSSPATFLSSLPTAERVRRYARARHPVLMGAGLAIWMAIQNSR